MVTLCLASCGRYQLPSFGSSSDWELIGNKVISSDMAVNFGGNDILANASNGDYDLHFITSQEGFNAYDTKCAKYLADVMKQMGVKE